LERELILSARRGNDTAFAELCKRYAPLIDSMTDKYQASSEAPGEGREDLRQEAAVSFYRAVMTYDLEQDRVTFGLYAKICIRNRMISLLRKNQAEKKRKPKRKEPLPGGGTVSGISREELHALADRFLTAYEKTAFFLYIDGKSYRDIAVSLGVSVKSVDNALFRAKTKLRSVYSM